MLTFIKGSNELLNLFIESMVAGQRDAVVLDYSDPKTYYSDLKKWDPLFDSDSIVICFNNIGLATRLPFPSDEGNTTPASQSIDLYWAIKKCTVYDILVDHPLFFTESLQLAPLLPRLHFICIDRHHSSLIKNMLPALSPRIHFIPHGGINTNDLLQTASYTGYASYRNPTIPENEHIRKIDIVYLGAGDTGNVSYPKLGISEINDSDFYEYAFYSLLNTPYIQEDMIVEEYAKEKRLELSVGMKLTLTALLLKTVHFDAMRSSKIKLVSALAEEGLHITVHGRGWSEIADKYPDYINEGKYLHPAECPYVMEQAYFTLNFQPFFSDGAHERVFGAMRSGSICVSNKSTYLESRFKNKEDIIYYDLNNLHETALYIKKILSDKNHMYHISENARVKVQNDKWCDRLSMLLKLT